MFVAFGAPKQEKWLASNLKNLKIGGAVVVGGSFDYVSGMRDLPPIWMQDRGLEWLWRVLNEPERAKRIFNATFLFSSRVFLYKLNM